MSPNGSDINYDGDEKIIINLTPKISRNDDSKGIYFFRDNEWVKEGEIKDSDLEDRLNKEEGYVKVGDSIYYVRKKLMRSIEVKEEIIEVSLKNVISEDNPFYYNKGLDESLQKLLSLGMVTKSFMSSKKYLNNLIQKVSNSKSEEDIEKQLNSIKELISDLSKGLYNVSVGLVGISGLVHSNGRNINKLVKKNK